MNCTRWETTLGVSLALLSLGSQPAATRSEQQTPVGRWRPTGNMNVRREYGGGVLLKNGKVLAVSGHPLSDGSIASAELYDPATGKWSVTGSLREARNGGNEAILLLDGRVLIAGGNSNTRTHSGAEIYDPHSGTWSGAGSISVARIPACSLLADGRVLASGGLDWNIDDGKAYDVAELYNPTLNTWSQTGSLLTARYAHQAVRLDNGCVLTVGGYRKGDVLLSSAELFDPATGRWTMTGSLPSTRVAFGTAKLRDGRVLVVGGFTGRIWAERAYVDTACIYDPKTGRWSSTMPMQQRRAGCSTTLLKDGRVLVAGGWAEQQRDLKSVEIFDPRSEKWQAAAPMTSSRRNHRATLLPTGDVLVMGGSNLFGGNYLSSCEIFSLP